MRFKIRVQNKRAFDQILGIIPADKIVMKSRNRLRFWVVLEEPSKELLVELARMGAVVNEEIKNNGSEI